MALHLFKAQHPSSSERTQLRLLAAYESGGVTLFSYTRTDKDTSVEGVGWDRLWTTKLHVETGLHLVHYSSCACRAHSPSSDGYGGLAR